MSIPTTTRRLALPMLTMTAVALLAACGGDAEPAPAEASGGALAEAFGLPGGGFGDTQQWADQETQIEESIAACMIAKGFEYIPVTSDADNFPDFTDAEARLEYARTNGFGIALAYDNPEYTDLFVDDTDDPNAELVEGMSESERIAYGEALDGTPEELAAIETEVDPETGEEYPLGSAGCRGEAYEAGYGGDAVYEAMAPLQEEIDERIEADPRYQALIATWRECMSAKGLDYEEPDAVYLYTDGEFAERVTAVLGFDPYGGIYDTMSEEDSAFLETATPAEAEARMAELEEAALADVDRAALRALQEEERTLAVAEAECTTPIFADGLAVYADVEATFVEENADRIAEAAAQVNG